MSKMDFLAEKLRDLASHLRPDLRIVERDEPDEPGEDEQMNHHLASIVNGKHYSDGLRRMLVLDIEQLEAEMGTAYEVAPLNRLMGRKESLAILLKVLDDLKE